MSVSVLVLLIIIGLSAGVFSGMVGLGGAIVMIPALVYFAGMGQHQAQGTSLAVMLPPVGILAAYNYYKAGQLNLKFAMIIAAAFIIGAYFGSGIALKIPAPAMRKIFGYVLAGVAVYMIFSKG
ncbi:MAG: sulfite exporter TauE/SafE family protein [Bacteroidales bacterium]